MKKFILFICFIFCTITINAEPKDSISIMLKNTPAYKAGRHLQLANYCEIGAIVFGAGSGICFATMNDETTRLIAGSTFGACALGLYIAKLCHIHQSGKYLKLVSSPNSIGVAYTLK